MEVTKVDVARAQNVIRALKKGKYELDGEEVLAFAQCFAWVGDLIVRMERDLAAPPPAAEPAKGPKTRSRTLKAAPPAEATPAAAEAPQ